MFCNFYFYPFIPFSYELWKVWHKASVPQASISSETGQSRAALCTVLKTLLGMRDSKLQLSLQLHRSRPPQPVMLLYEFCVAGEIKAQLCYINISRLPIISDATTD